jgi:hypothetical protein
MNRTCGAVGRFTIGTSQAISKEARRAAVVPDTFPTSLD